MVPAELAPGDAIVSSEPLHVLPDPRVPGELVEPEQVGFTVAYSQWENKVSTTQPRFSPMVWDPAAARQMEPNLPLTSAKRQLARSRPSLNLIWPLSISVSPLWLIQPVTRPLGSMQR